MAELLLVAAFAAAYLGFAGLALSLQRHWCDALERTAPSPRRPTVLRLTGYMGLALALVLALVRDGESFGLVLWVLLLASAAASVALTLSVRPRWLAWLARAFR